MSHVYRERDSKENEREREIIKGRYICICVYSHGDRIELERARPDKRCVPNDLCAHLLSSMMRQKILIKVYIFSLYIFLYI